MICFGSAAPVAALEENRIYRVALILRHVLAASSRSSSHFIYNFSFYIR